MKKKRAWRKRWIALGMAMLLLSNTTVYAVEEEEVQEPQKVFLSVEMTGQGTVSVEGEEIEKIDPFTYRGVPNTPVTITATPAEGYELERMMLGEEELPVNPVMPETDQKLSVVFKEIIKEEPETPSTEEPSTEEEEPGEPPVEEDEPEEPPVEEGEPEELPVEESEPEAPVVENLNWGIEMTSLFMKPTIRSSGIPMVGQKVTGSCYIGDGWTVNYPYQDYFNLSGWTGDLKGATTIRDFECLNPTAALPHYMNASYEATVSAVNVSGGYVEYEVYVTPPGATDGVTTDGSGHLLGYQHVGGRVRVARQFVGSLELRKSSANPEITSGNNCYSLAGAVYGLYQGGTKKAELKTNAQGIAKVGNLAPGKYTLKELTPPKGFALDLAVYSVTINAGQTTITRVTDKPQNDPVSVLLGKIDKETTQNMPQGSASLEGAEFTYKFYSGYYDTDPAKAGQDPLRTWVMKTNQQGKTALVESLKVSGDEFYKNADGVSTLPLGTLTIQETKAPEGYLLNEEVFVRQITAEGTAEGVETYNMPVIEEQVIRGDVRILKYGETNSESDDSGADIKRPLEGVKFHFTSKTTAEVFTIVTDKQGCADTAQLGNPRGGLPFDTYVVTEESPYPEYDLVAPFEVTISEESQVLYYILRNDTIDAPIAVQKVDAETGKMILIAGAKFQLLDENKKVISMIVSHYPSTITQDVWETDANGSFVLPEKLEHGTYYLREIKGPNGYLVSQEDLGFIVDKEHQWDKPLTIKFKDSPVKGKVRIKKTDEVTGNPLKGAEYDILAAEDIKTPDGTVRAAKGEVVDHVVTDRLGDAESKELYLGNYQAVETKAPEGYVLDKEPHEFELTYQDDRTPIVYTRLNLTNKPEKEKVGGLIPKMPHQGGSGMMKAIRSGKTGDMTKILPYAFAALVAGGAIVILLRKRRNTEKEEDEKNEG